MIFLFVRLAFAMRITLDQSKLRYTFAMQQKEIVIDARFKGPPDSGNGGYTAGLIANELPGAVKVMLRYPPPLNMPLSLKHENGRAELTHGEQVIASAETSELDLTPPAFPTRREIESQAHTYVSAEEHILSTCFVCGPDRAAGDGLQVFPVVIPDNQCVASIWKPVANLAADDGLIATEILWAALDCPGYFAHREPGKPMLLGSITGQVYRRPSTDENLRSVGWHLRADGRKYFSATAVVDEQDEICAASEQIWIALK